MPGALRGSTKGREEAEANGRGLPGTTQVEAQGEQGLEEGGEKDRQIKQAQREKGEEKEILKLSFKILEILSRNEK